MDCISDAFYGEFHPASAGASTDQQNADTEISSYSPVVTALGADNAAPHSLAWWGRIQ